MGIWLPKPLDLCEESSLTAQFMQQWIQELPWLGMHRSGMRTQTLTSQLVFVRVFHISQAHTQKLVSLPGHRWCWQAAASSCWPRGWRLQQHGAEPASAYGKGQLPCWGYLLHYPYLWARQSQHPWAITVWRLLVLQLKVKKKHSLKRGRNIPVVAELRLSWFISISFSLSHEFFLCVCLYAGIIPR